jgi:AcrR family transcriptional regulator
MMVENLKVIRGRETADRLVKTAAALFGSKGFNATPAEEIVSLARVTRGALYHHFKNKEGLFLAAFKAMQAEISEQIMAAVEQENDPWEQLLAGCRGFLEACLDPRRYRIILLEGPAVLGWQLWRDLDAQYGTNDLRQGLQELMDKGELKELPVEPLTRLLTGAMNEGVLWISNTKEKNQVVEEVMTVLTALLEGLRR